MINEITSASIQTTVPQNAGQSTVTPVARPASKPSQNTSVTPDSSLKVVNTEVITAIDKELATTNATPIRNLNADDFTPESVANGILSYVQNAITRATARGQSASELMAQARQGIEDGFNQAKDILSSLNALSGQIAQGVQKTYDLIQSGLQEIETAQKNGTTVNFNRPPAEVTNVSQQTQSASRSFELNITTRDGDTVKINVSQSQSQQQYEASRVQGDTSVSFSQSQSRSSNSFEFTVIGSLDQAEITAVEEMLAEAKAISENFFNGEVSTAFEAGLSLGFNTKEIASFALGLTENQTQSASRAYREVSNFGSEGSRVSPSQLENLLKPANNYMLGLRDNVEKAVAADLPQNDSQKSTEELFNYFSRADANNAAQIQRFESLTGGSFENMTQQLISSVLS